MSSLWSSIKKGKVETAKPLSPATGEFIADLRASAPTLVNITSFMEEKYRLSMEENPIGQDSLDITPCRRELWLESSYGRCSPQATPRVGGLRQAIYATRQEISELKENGWQGPTIPAEARHLITFELFQEQDGIAMLWGVMRIFSDNLGEPMDLYSETEHADPEDKERMNTLAWVGFEVLTIMNTRGTRIEPPLEKLPAEMITPNRAPHSVWRTIHLPQFKAPPLNALIDGPMLERRQHWVRAHRKDYRLGAGMFGRVKALVWVPEFQRGNPELGTVKQSFTVKKPEER